MSTPPPQRSSSPPATPGPPPRPASSRCAIRPGGSACRSSSADGNGAGLPDPAGEYDFVERVVDRAHPSSGCAPGARSTARGEVVAFTEDHCEPAPDWCERIIAAHAEHPDADAVGGAMAQRHRRRSCSTARTSSSRSASSSPRCARTSSRAARRRRTSPSSAGCSTRATGEEGWLEFVAVPTAFRDGPGRRRRPRHRRPPPGPRDARDAGLPLPQRAHEHRAWSSPGDRGATLKARRERTLGRSGPGRGRATCGARAAAARPYATVPRSSRSRSLTAPGELAGLAARRRARARSTWSDAAVVAAKRQLVHARALADQIAPEPSPCCSPTTPNGSSIRGEPFAILRPPDVGVTLRDAARARWPDARRGAAARAPGAGHEREVAAQPAVDRDPLDGDCRSGSGRLPARDPSGELLRELAAGRARRRRRSTTSTARRAGPPSARGPTSRAARRAAGA